MLWKNPKQTHGHMHTDTATDDEESRTNAESQTVIRNDM